jgi:dolichol-phosphate mannosyltransferase
MVSPVMIEEKDQNISVVVPMLNESGNAASLIGEIQAAGEDCPIAEIVIVDDGSTDDTAAIIQKLRQNDPRIRLVRHSRRCGQSTALRTGIRAATGPIVATMDGDGQNDPADIPALYLAFAATPPGTKMLLVAGQRKKRMDSLLKKFTSRTGNTIRSWLLQDGVRDTGCSLKMFRRDDYLTLPFFNHMHRYIPALFRREHGTVVLVDVGHRPREQGTSKYGFWDRLWAGIFDIFGVLWLQKRGCPPVDVMEG